MGTDKNKQKKYVSVRKALRELRVDEGELKKIIEKGAIKAYPDKDNVKFDADEIEKYRTSRIQNNEENPKIADESLYESADVSFDSLFVSQAQGRSAASLTEEIPQEPDILFGPSTPKQNIKDFLNKKKPDPVSPVKAIQSVRSRDKGTTGIVSFSLFIVIIMLISINSFLLLQIGGAPTLPKINESKAINDELVPQISIVGKVVPAQTHVIVAPASGKIKQLVTTKLNKDKVIAVIDNANSLQREQLRMELQQALLTWELQKNKVSGLSAKAQKEIAQISEMYRKKGTVNSSNLSSWKKGVQSFAKSIKPSALDVWLQLQKARQNYELAEKKWLQNAQNNTIKASFAGQLLSSYSKVGNNVQAGDILGEYHSSTHQLQVVMSKSEFRLLEMQNQVTVTLPNDEQQKGKIHSAVAEDHLVKVNISIKMPVNLGMQLKVTFSLKKIPECVLVDRRAVFFQKDIRGESQAMVCKVLRKKGKRYAYPVSVVVGLYDEDYIQILSGVDPGDVIAMATSTPLANFTSGQQLQD
ncbi:efflux RND transporter periplasmic adaptor subunit [Candidatus Uabimicrobium amorphum]|uniref:RND efflux pump membrane fusion protein barrel-sandwich domain-containing protein n=1 Tax=Uabimicrobium amorphum TaxID=2596890 RepID=A0A5S9IKZ1_UABAM|nr:efflux RND transporter periplasmic adaptor subunit [Candidatus Uabimicrobium amorphum]BBM83624.1 hypothetical protein UABAM_01977 [Candidatus Uabimicrobium amorphum]